MYVETALYFKVLHNLDWSGIDPRIILSYPYSAIDPWIATVSSAVAQIPNLPKTQSQASWSTAPVSLGGVNGWALRRKSSRRRDRGSRGRSVADGDDGLAVKC